ncbi:acyltransferase [Ruminococcus sp.]|uniref:acyltransferase n=1 Tax=Ruminococcus sp. TaxID=41978 RepID=UPI004026EB60
MNLEKLQNRNPAMDILRIVAVLCVISIHFFYHTGYYNTTADNVPMYFATVLRTLFSVCVPLFMILSGFLLCNKTLKKGYYSGIRKTIIVYILVAIACIIYKSCNGSYTLTTLTFFTGIFDFTGANYSWYIEMYIGLFLIVPFLNIIYKNLDSRKQKNILLITLIAITILPSLFNAFKFDSYEWWANPAADTDTQKLMPSWWVGIYPITYYFTGCYIREYGTKIKNVFLIIALVIAIFGFGTFNFYRCYGSTFTTANYVYWYGIEPYVMSVLIFLIISKLKLENINVKAKFVLWKISDLVLGTYLVSFIFDSIYYYEILNINTPDFYARFPFMPLMILCVFVSALISSGIINLIAAGIEFCYKKICNLCKEKFSKKHIDEPKQFKH